jgi:hypothetical protein
MKVVRLPVFRQGPVPASTGRLFMLPPVSDAPSRQVAISDVCPLGLIAPCSPAVAHSNVELRVIAVPFIFTGLVTC